MNTSSGTQPDSNDPFDNSSSGISVPTALKLLNTMKGIIVILFFVIGLGTLLVLSSAQQEETSILVEYNTPEAQRERIKQKIDSYADCVSYGYPVIEGFPKQCSVPDGEVYTKAIEEPASAVPDGGVISQVDGVNVYNSEAINFSFSYPLDWELYEETNFYTSLAQPTSSITLGDGDQYFAISAHYSGDEREVCNPRRGDEFHSLDAACATTEVLDYEMLNQVVRADLLDGDSAEIRSYLLDRKVTFPNTTSSAGTQYQVCLLFSSRDPLLGSEFGLGRTPPTSPIIRNSQPEVFYLESCAYSDDESFLSSAYADVVRDIYASIAVVE